HRSGRPVNGLGGPHYRAPITVVLCGRGNAIDARGSCDAGTPYALAITPPRAMIRLEIPPGGWTGRSASGSDRARSSRPRKQKTADFGGVRARDEYERVSFTVASLPAC